MPTTPYAAVQISVNGGPQRTGGLALNFADVIQLSAQTTAGWKNQIWEITYFPIGYATPSGWTLNSDGLVLSSTSVIPPPFTLPAVTNWGKWMIRLRINDALTDDKADAKFTDTSCAISIESLNGLRDLGKAETNQFGTGWDTDHQHNLRQIDAGLGGGGGGGTLAGDVTGPTGANIVQKIHNASVPIAGALTVGNLLQVSAAAALTYAALNLAGGANFVTGRLPADNVALGTANQVFVTDGAATANVFVTPAGDWTGAVTANVVGKIKGTAVTTAGGALATGLVLQTTGVASADWGLLSATASISPGGADRVFVTNAANTSTVWAVSAGDWTGPVGTNVVGRIKGTTVTTPGGALTTGQSLRVTGVATADWGAVDLANAAAVTGALPLANIAQGGATSTQVLAWNGATWAPAAPSVGSGSVAPGTNGQFFVTAGGISTWATAAGDVTGPVTALVVGRINGATVPIAGSLTTGNVLQVSGAAALSYGFIANANVDPAAAIAGTKVSPNFGSQNVLTSGTLGAGATTVTSLTVSTLGAGIVHSSAGGVFSSSAIVVGDVSPGTVGQFFVTGAGPAAAWATAAGDWTGPVTANVVGKVKGTTVTTAGGALVTGQALRATGVSSADWGPIDLANANAVVGIISVANLPASAVQFQNVADIAAMQALVVTSLLDGTHCWVRILKRGFILDTNAQTPSADSDTYASATAGRIWMGFAS